MMTKKIWFGSLAGLCITGLGAALVQHAPSLGKTHTARLAPDAASAAPAPLPEGPGWGLGARYSYDLTMAIRIGLPEAAPAQQVKGAEDDSLQLAGALDTTVVASTAERVTLAYQITLGRIQEGNGAPATGTLSRDIGKPFYVQLDERGVVSSVAFSPGISEDAHTLLRNLVAALRVPRGARSAEPWTEHELDTNGECTVRYACPGPGCSKEKQAYVRVVSGNGLVAAGPRSPLIRQSHFSYATDGSGRLLSMAGKEIAAVDLLGTSVRAELSLVLRFKTAALEGGAIAGVPSGLEQLSLATASTSFSGNGAAQLPDDLRGATTASLSAEYLKLDPSDREARGRVVARLSALFQRDPAAIAEAERLIRQGAPAALVLAETLGGANGREGQAALANVLRDPSIASDVRAAALRSALLIERPNSALVDALRTEMKDSEGDLRNRARVAFGAGANRLRESDPDVARGMTDELLKDLHAANAPDERMALLRALGNTGSERADDTLLAAAADPDPAIREAAMRALRFVRDTRAARVISQALLSDSVLEVRRAALFAAGFQPAASVVPALSQLARADEDHALRAESMKTLAKIGADSAEALQTLTDLAASEPDPELRALATSLLDRALARSD